MKKSWYIVIFVAAVMITVVITLNYKSRQKSEDLSELVSEEESSSPDVQYEFMDNAPQTTENAAGMTESMAPTAMKPAPQAAPAPSLQPATMVKPKNSSLNEPEAYQAKATSVPSAPSVSPSAAAAQHTFTIQVSSFKDQKKADLFLAEVRKKEATAYMLTKELGEKGTRYRICVGDFMAKAQADEYLKKIQEIYKEGFVVAIKK